MLALAEQVAEANGIALSEDVRISFDACRAFLDSHALPPTEKQRALADKLAGERGIGVPSDALTSRKALSEWIEGVMAG
jgi:hypothetical protein